MSITRVQNKSTNGISSSASLSYTSTTTAGNLLIAIVTCYSNSVNSVPSNWNNAVIDNDVNGNWIGIYYYGASSATTSVTFGLASSNRWVLYLAEYSGIASATPLDQTNTGTSATISGVSGSITTTLASGVAIIGFSDQNGSQYNTPTNGFTVVDTRFGVVQAGSAYLEQIISSPGTYSGSATADSGSGINGVIASFGDLGSSLGVDLALDYGL